MQQMSAEPRSDNPESLSFWSWSLARYARPGAESLLLRLQDECGLNVNVLLWAVWCAEHFEAAPEIAFRKALDDVNAWQGRVTKPLCGIRRDLKSLADMDGADALRVQVKASELAAEKIEQTMLQKTALTLLASDASRAPDDTERRARQNLATYAALANAPRNKGFSTSLLHALIEIMIDDAPGDVKTGSHAPGNSDE